MNVTAQYFLGSSYASPDGKDCIRFSSIKNAIDHFLSICDFDPYYPCVDAESAEMLIFFGKHKDVTDMYPDRLYTIGKRGGIVRNYC